MSDWDTFEKIDGKAVALRVKQLRAKNNLTQTELADRAEVSQQSICAIERGAIKLPRALPKLAKVLCTTARYLITGVEDDGAPMLNVVTAEQLRSKLNAIEEGNLGTGYNYLKPSSINVKKCFSIKSLDSGMNPEIKLGDYLIIDTDRNIKPSDFVLIGFRDEILVRKFRMQTQDTSEYVPLNPDFPTIKTPDEIFGVISEIRKLC